MNSDGSGTAAKGLRSLTGYIDANGNAVMFASTYGSGPNLLLGLFDPAGNTVGSGVTETGLVDATNSSAFNATGIAWNLRGVAIIVPEPTTITLMIVAFAGMNSRRRRA